MDDGTASIVHTGCVNVRQGDVVALASVVIASDNESGTETLPTPHGVVVLSQTCDVVQPTKSRCLVAPVFEAEASEVSAARKGRKPLHLYWQSAPQIGSGTMLADMEVATSVPKTALVGREILARAADHTSGSQASDVAARVGRAFNRFPFPDEVHPVFQKLRARVQDKAGGKGSFGRVMDLLDDLRVSADQWNRPGRRLRLLILVPENLTVPADEQDANWAWAPHRVPGMRSGEQLQLLDLDRVCELILAAISDDTPDRTTLARLWTRFGATIEETMLRPRLNAEVVEIEVEVVSTEELTYVEYRQSESLDLEVLSTPVRVAPRTD